MEERATLGLALSIRSAFYTRDYLGIALVGEIRNTAGNTVQLTDWVLELPVQKLALAGGPPRGGGLYPGAPWWPAPPMLIEARRLAVGAVFFYAPHEWNNALPENPLQGRLRAAIFPDKVIESDVEIRGLPAITETEHLARRSTQPSSREGLNREGPTFWQGPPS